MKVQTKQTRLQYFYFSSTALFLREATPELLKNLGIGATSQGMESDG